MLNIGLSDSRLNNKIYAAPYGSSNYAFLYKQVYPLSMYT